MKKKVLSALLSASMLLSTVATQSISSIAAGEKVYACSDAAGIPGSTVTVTISIESDVKLTAYGIAVSYDADKLEAKGFNTSANTWSGTHGVNLDTDLTRNPFTLAAFGSAQEVGGTLATIDFLIKDTATPGEDLTLTISDVGSTSDDSYANVGASFELAHGTITVIDHTEAKSVELTGESFVVAGDDLPLEAVAKDVDGNELDKEITWALKAPTPGFSIDGSTLKTTAAATAKKIEVVPTVVNGGPEPDTDFVGDPIEIEVFIPVTGISIAQGTIYPDQEVDLNAIASLTPTDPTVSEIVWSGENVTEAGIFKAGVSGTFAVTATVVGGTRPEIGEGDTATPAEDFVQENILVEVTEPVRETPPTAPRYLTAYPDDSQVTITWTVPAYNGGAAITGYEVSISSNSGVWIPVTATNYTFKGLTNESSYTFTVRAVNSVGAGESVSVSAIPAVNDSPVGTPSGSAGYYRTGGGSGSTSALGGTGGTSKLVSGPTAKKAADAAIKNAGESGKGTAKFANVTGLTKDAVTALLQAAKDAGIQISLIFDTKTKDNKVDVRLILDAESLDKAINVYGSTNDTNVTKVMSKFGRFYSNVLQVVNLGQRGSYGQDVKVAFKSDITDVKGLAIYVYDPTTNKCTRIKTEIRVDKNGYIHVTVPMGGQIIVTDGVIAKK